MHFINKSVEFIKDALTFLFEIVVLLELDFVFPLVFSVNSVDFSDFFLAFFKFIFDANVKFLSSSILRLVFLSLI